MKKILLAVLLAFCAKPALADIKIAVAGPVSGQYASFGEQMVAGAKQAVADINVAGGVNGQQLQLEVGDDACDPKQARAVASRFADAGVVFVAGHFCSGSSIPASEIYDENEILMISPGSTNPQLTDAGKAGVFRVCGRDDRQGLVVADYIGQNYAKTKIAILHDKSAYGQGLAEQVRLSLTDKKIPVALFEAYTAGERDYTALVSRMKQAGIEVLFVGGYHTEAGLLVRQMREQGMSTQLIGGDALMTTEFATITGAAGNGTLMTFGPDPRLNPAAQAVAERFRKAGYEPEGYTLYTYAAIQAFAAAADSAKSTEFNKLLPILREQQFSTVIGDVAFDHKGDIKGQTYVLYRWQDGKFAQLPASAPPTASETATP